MFDINSLSGIEFENLCVELLEKMGFETQTTKASGDGGIDIIAFDNHAFFKGKYIIQCKRYTGSVGEPVIRDLYGVVMAERANKGVLITTGKFTNAALSFAVDKQLELIDGDELHDLTIQHSISGVGINSESASLERDKRASAIQDWKEQRKKMMDLREHDAEAPEIVRVLREGITCDDDMRNTYLCDAFILYNSFFVLFRKIEDIEEVFNDTPLFCAIDYEKELYFKMINIRDIVDFGIIERGVERVWTAKDNKISESKVYNIKLSAKYESEENENIYFPFEYNDTILRLFSFLTNT